MPSFAKGALAIVAGAFVLVAGSKAQALERVTCRGEFGTGSGLAGSYIGYDCLLGADTPEEAAVQKVCNQGDPCVVVGLATKKSGRTVVRKIVSVSKGPAIDAKAAEATVREILSRVFSTVLTVKDKQDDDKRFMTPELYALFQKNARDFNGDPYTGSQEPESYKLVSLSVDESKDPSTVSVIARYDIQGLPDQHPVIAYEMVNDGTRWRVADIRYVSDKTTMRGILRKVARAR